MCAVNQLDTQYEFIGMWICLIMLPIVTAELFRFLGVRMKPVRTLLLSLVLILSVLLHTANASVIINGWQLKGEVNLHDNFQNESITITLVDVDTAIVEIGNRLPQIMQVNESPMVNVIKLSNEFNNIKLTVTGNKNRMYPMQSARMKIEGFLYGESKNLTVIH